MNTVQLDLDIYLILLAVTVLLFGLAGFIIYFIVLYRKKQVLNSIEKEKLAMEFQQEIFKTQMEVQEQTMQTIGADLHDNIGQLLSLTSLTLNSIELDEPAKARQKINASIDLTIRSIKELRLLGKLLQGDQLMALGLAEAIRHEISWMEKSGKYDIIHNVDGDEGPHKNPDKNLIIFRMVQEILNNIIKHASANQIIIKLEYQDKATKLQIIDNGKGFNPEELPSSQKGMGLFNMQKRAAIIGGECSIKSQVGEGTRIDITIPNTQHEKQ
ncbi:MAG: sensor histidine kinase [Mucilaginibacter sp.]